MKKTHIALFICFAALLLTSCSSSAEKQNDEPYYDTSARTLAATSASEAIPAEAPAIVSDEKFGGIDIAAPTPLIGNLQQNLKNWPFSGYVCYDGGSDTLYYTDVGGDNYLYSLKDGEKTLILEKTVKSINALGGKLYFILCGDGSGVISSDNALQNVGDICCYDLEAQTLQTLIDTSAVTLTVTETHIYYGVVTISEAGSISMDGFSAALSEGSLGEAEPKSCFFEQLYGECSLEQKDGALYLEKDGELLKPWSEAFPDKVTFVGDRCYYTPPASNALSVIDMKSGEEHLFDDLTYSVPSIAEDGTLGAEYERKFEYLGDYAVVGDDTYMIYRDIIKIDENFGITDYQNTENEKLYSAKQSGVVYEALYTDGNTLYALKRAESGKRLELVRLIISEDGTFSEGKVG